MKLIILCGGAGSRLEDYSLPKPLNMIYGQPAISYTLENLPPVVTDLYFVVSAHLEKYNFRTIVTNLFKTRRCHFLPLSYFTRGPIESAFVGTSGLVCDGEPVIFLDNDILYHFPADFFSGPKPNAFLGYSVDTTGSTAYSFLTLTDSHQVQAIKEKQRISHNFCVGVYGFATLTQFREIALRFLERGSSSGELYMSLLFDTLLREGKPVDAVRFPGEVAHIGSLRELRTAVAAGRLAPRKPMRICFDLDNTLVTYPQIPGDYSTVAPIPAMIGLARKLKAEGHTIILHTARRMATHSGNAAAAMADIGRITFETLAKYEIPCDEILFGKPIADMYIDDRAVNPYRHDMTSLGLIDYAEEEVPLNKLPNNQHNRVSMEGGVVVKRGPPVLLEGEIYYHSVLPPSLAPMFATFLGAAEGMLRTAQIKGVPAYTLYKSQLLTPSHVKQMFEFLDVLHSTLPTDAAQAQPTTAAVKAAYGTKLRERFAVAANYDFADAAELRGRVLEVADAVEKETPLCAPFIHGDFWLSNLLFSFGDGALKAIDMRGRIGDLLTTGGDRYYDYAKLYQSFVGYDAVLYGEAIPTTYQSAMMNVFETQVTERGLNLQHIRKVALVLMAGTFFGIGSKVTRERMGAWLLRLMPSCGAE
jgi:capsule biosynthesis phosphatase